MVASILVVDDDAALRDVMCRRLRFAGHAVEEATDASQALRLLQAGAWDLLITDILMRNGDGIELITAVRQADPDVSIMAICGRAFLGSLDLLDVAARLGADAILAKPLSYEHLLDQVAALVGGGRARTG